MKCKHKWFQIYADEVPPNWVTFEWCKLCGGMRETTENLHNDKHPRVYYRKPKNIVAWRSASHNNASTQCPHFRADPVAAMVTCGHPDAVEWYNNVKAQRASG